VATPTRNWGNESAIIATGVRANLATVKIFVNFSEDIPND